MSKPKIVIIGLDSATWDLLGPWADQGLLPNLRNLRDSGVAGELESAIPPLTPPAWTSFMTGKNPGKHGIFYFLEPQPGSYAMRYANAGSRRSKTVFGLLSEAGLTVTSVNIPFTYPPEQMNGCQISGMDTPSEQSPFIYPPELRAELESVVGKVRFDVTHLGFMSTDERRQKVLAEMEQVDQQWAKLGLHLLDKRPTDLMMFTFMSIDTVQHHFWQFMDQNHFMHDSAAASKFGDAILRVYQRLDTIVGRFLQRLPDDTTILVVSDHGGGPVSDRVIYLNRFLAQLGLLAYKEQTQSGFARTKQHLVRSVYKVLYGTLGPKQKKFLAGLLPGARERMEGAFTSFANIDWAATKAYCSEILASPPSIWINKKGEKPAGIVSEEEYEPLLAEITGKLGELKDPRTGEPIISRVHRRDELFHGPFAKEAPDLILDWWSANAFSTKPSFPEEGDQPPVRILPRGPVKGPEWGGTHRKAGVFIGKGKAFNPGTRLEGARLIDLAPTLLYLLGQKVPADMDGRVLTAAFDPRFLQQNTTNYQDVSEVASAASDNASYSPQEAAQIEARLKALGYID
ncbi:MAG TPA: alkaline phosphatase family protein [Chthoniobacterales bacterium]|nr:alkaline phosphatase family protein [Chthoniobacterales bacterium]